MNLTEINSLIFSFYKTDRKTVLQVVQEKWSNNKQYIDNEYKPILTVTSLSVKMKC